MKHTPLQRSTPLRRKTRLRARGDTAYRRRDRDLLYMRWVRRQSCAVRTLTALEMVWMGMSAELAERAGDPCYGRVEADHAGRRPGVSMKAGDRTCIPLCQKHHAARGDFRGMFSGWNGQQMRMWLDSVIQRTQAEYERVGIS